MTAPFQPFPLHLRTRPESGSLPHGWLKELQARYEEGPEGFIVVDRQIPDDLSPPRVLGWGLDRNAARAAATRNSNRNPATFLVYPCTWALREQAIAGPADCLVYEDVAYTLTEKVPENVMADYCCSCLGPADLLDSAL